MQEVWLQDWIVAPEFPLVAAGRRGGRLGALGDIGSHIVDVAQHLTA